MALSAGASFIIALIIILILTAAGYVLYTHYRARRLGLPPPSLNPFSTNPRSNTTSTLPSYRAPAPAPGGLKGWFETQWSHLRANTRTSSGGAYETNTGYGGGSGGNSSSRRDRRGFGPLDPDEAWDARVDHEAGGYYEENELGGLQGGAGGPYGGSGYGEVGVGGIPVDERGRSRSREREVDRRYEEEMHGCSVAARPTEGKRATHLNPFGDQNEASSLRSVSPRPHGDSGGRGAQQHKKGQASLGSMEGADSSPTERRSMFHEDV
ncbi:hypothetical protein LTR62_004024 [Meristemomyces frigidus]|uniref:Acid phosphatase-like protein n=1 Tax=Meristemomyces frigidus TaxID=1508187 RepID=A0AAN7TX30_9PEZI|nr:hypothetical protein LTR62_004024 [Meristemomyces frigidus]